MEVAAAAGIIVGNSDHKLELLHYLDNEKRSRLRAYLKVAHFTVELLDSSDPFDIRIIVSKGQDNAEVRITGSHTNVVRICRNGEVLQHSGDAIVESKKTEDVKLSVEKIYDFAVSVCIDDVRPIQVQDQLQQVVKRVGRDRIVIGADCTLPGTTDPKRIRSVVHMCEKM